VCWKDEIVWPDSIHHQELKARLREQTPAGKGADRSTPEPDPALGHEMPMVTGHLGLYARAMITAWQKKQGLPETGFLDETQLVALLEQVTLTRPAVDALKVDARQRTATASAKYYHAQQRENPRRTK
jgi:hypothetical protein